jgi:hypothetical protein
MKTSIFPLLFVAALGLSACQQEAAPAEELAAPADSAQAAAAFEAMKSLVGTWEGTLVLTDGREMPTSSEFRLVSGGNTIVETLIEDGVEMATTFTLENGRMVTKHYCALGTEPTFEGTVTEDGNIDFTLSSSSPYTEGADNFVTSMSVEMPKDGSESIVWNGTVSMAGENVGRTAVLTRVEDK